MRKRKYKKRKNNSYKKSNSKTNKKLIGSVSILSIVIVTLILSIMLLSGGDKGNLGRLNGGSEDSEILRNMSNKKLIYEYSDFLEDYKIACNDTARKYSGVELESTYPVAGNANWWTTLTSTANDKHIPIYSSSTGLYAIEGQLGKSTYFATGLMFFMEGEIGGDIYWSRIQENILNGLLGTDDFRDKELTIFVNDPNRISLQRYFNDYDIGHNITILSGRDRDLSNLDYDLYMGSNPTKKQIEDTSNKGVPMYVSYNQHWEYDNYTYELFDITISSWNAKPLITTPNCEGSTYKDMEDIYNILDTLVNGELELMIPSNWSCNKALETDSACNFDDIYIKNSGTTSIMDFYYNPVRKLRDAIKSYDKRAIDIFSLDYGYGIKIALAVAENFRESVVYDVEALNYTAISDHTQFYQTMFADTIINYASPENELTNSLGTFSPNEDEIQKLETHDETIKIDKLFGKKATGTGVYVKAGQTTTITRKDTVPYNLTLYINYQTDLASQIYSDKAYSRPYTDRSNGITIKPGETYNISSPKGGTLFFDNQSSAIIEDLEIEVKNVLNNPYLDKFDDESIYNFAAELTTTPFNYVDVITPHIQLHSTTSNMIKAFDEFGDPKAYIGALLKYWGGVNYYYGGFLGDEVPARSSDINQFFSDRDLTAYANDPNIHERGQEHSYSDRASCGYMCATGEMTDSPAPFNPFGWGENHELGHKMQNSYTKIYGNASGEVSNNIYPMEVARQHAKDRGDTYYFGHSGYNNEAAFAAVVKGYGNVTSSNYLWSASNMLFNRLAIYQQMTYAAADEEFFAKMNIMARILYHNTDEENFNYVKDGLGFSTYQIASEITSNDFMAITGSLIADRDLSSFFEGMGIEISDQAKTQINTVTYSRTKIPYGKYYFVPGLNGNYGYTPVDFINDPNIDDYLINISDGIWYNPTL